MPSQSLALLSSASALLLLCPAVCLQPLVQVLPATLHNCTSSAVSHVAARDRYETCSPCPGGSDPGHAGPLRRCSASPDSARSHPALLPALASLLPSSFLHLLQAQNVPRFPQPPPGLCQVHMLPCPLACLSKEPKNSLLGEPLCAQPIQQSQETWPRGHKNSSLLSEASPGIQRHQVRQFGAT